MKNLIKLLLLVVCLTASAADGGAQTPADGKIGASVKTRLGELVRRQAIDKAVRAAAATTAPSDACDTPIPIVIGQSIGATISGNSCRLDDGSYANFYVFTGTQGQAVSLQMYSSQIDSYLGLANESGTFVVEDDDSGGGLTASITATLPANGTYIILANTALPNQFGGYTLRLSGAVPCTFAISPGTIEIPAAGGTYTFNVITQAECQWQAWSVSSFATTNSRGTGNGTVTFTVPQNGSGETRGGSLRVSSAPHPTLEQSFNFTQSSITCTYALSPASVNLPAQASTGSFSIVAPAGCPWSVQDGAYARSTGSGTGNGTINYSITHNNGAARTDIIRVGGLNFTINQAGLNCDFKFTATTMTIGRQGGTRTISFDAQPGCIWSANTNSTFLTVQNRTGTGAGTIIVRVQPQTEAGDRSGAVSVEWSSGSRGVWIDQSRRNFNTTVDFDGDLKADVAVYRPSNGVWYANNSAQGFSAAQFGASGDVIVPADYDADGKTDFAVFRPSNGTWFWINSGTGTLSSLKFGASDDVPAPADFDGDGAADPTVFRPSNGTWYQQYLNYGAYGFRAHQFGASGDVPTAGDFDGDGKADLAVYRPSNGVWYRLNSGSSTPFYAVQFGAAGDKAVPADYDGDGRTDAAVFRPSNGVWYRLNSIDNSFVGVGFGLSGDKPAPADYDGDGKADVAVFRPSNATWYLQMSTTGFAARQFGAGEDVPTAGAFVR